MLYIFIFFSFLNVESIWANDTAVADYAGSMRFIKEHDISIEKEILELESELIVRPGYRAHGTKFRVTYEMKNNSNKDKKVEIAFPLPDTSIYHHLTGITHSPNRYAPKMHLSVEKQKISGQWVESLEFKGQPIKAYKNISEFPEFDVRFCDGTSQSGVTPADCGVEQIKVCSKLKKELGLKSCSEAIGALIAKRTFRWSYVFPANKQILVVHEYTVPRGFSQMLNPDEDQAMLITTKVAGVKNIKKPFCMEEMIPQWQKNLDRLVYHWSEYVLSTGANWKGPIKHFELRLRHNENELISSCFPNLKRTGDREWRAVIKDFIPDSELVVGFFQKKLRK